MTTLSMICPVCFEPRDATTTTTLTNCSHQCCTSCLRQHLQTSIHQGTVVLTCFHIVETEHCRGRVTEDELRHLVDIHTFHKYQRFVFNHHHPVFGRQCPSCEHSQVFPQGDEEPQCTCEACGQVFCFTHGIAHPTQSCEDYDKQRSHHTIVEQQSQVFLRKTTKPCPRCTVAIEKDGGCNHMTCLQCGTSFCWICGAHVQQSSTPQHYQGWRFGGCAGLQHTEIDVFSYRYRLYRAFLRGLSTVAVGIPALTITTTLTVISLGWYPLIRWYGVTFTGACTGCFEVVATRIQEGYVEIGNGLARRSQEAQGGMRNLFHPQQK